MRSACFVELVSPGARSVGLGAQANVMCFGYYQRMRKKSPTPLEGKVDEQLLSVSGTPLIVKGIVFIPVRIAGTLLRPNVRFFVVDDLPHVSSVILGLEFILEHLHAVFWNTLTFSL